MLEQLFDGHLTVDCSSTMVEVMTEKLFVENLYMKGLFVAGGGISGAMNALRTSGLADKIIVVAHQLMNNTRGGLLDGILSMVLHVPLDKLAPEALAIMARSCSHPERLGRSIMVLPFDIYTRENISVCLTPFDVLTVRPQT